MDIEDLRNRLTAISDAINNPSLKNTRSDKVDLDAKIKEFNSLVEKLDNQQGDIFLSNNKNIQDTITDLIALISEIASMCQHELEILEFIDNIKPKG